MCLLVLLVNILYFLPEGNMVADTSRRQAAELAGKRGILLYFVFCILYFIFFIISYIFVRWCLLQ